MLLNQDPTCHAEVQAIRNACKSLKTFDLKGLVLYTSCEPCPMCSGAIYWSGISKVFYANTAAQAASVGFGDLRYHLDLRKEPKDRAVVPFIHVPSKEAEEGFELWARKDDKQPY